MVVKVEFDAENQESIITVLNIISSFIDIKEYIKLQEQQITQQQSQQPITQPIPMVQQVVPQQQPQVTPVQVNNIADKW